MERSRYSVHLRQDKASLWKGKGFLLGKLDIELTERCNNNCLHCFINLPADDITALQSELSTEEIKEVLRESVSLGCLMVRFTGGEPLLRDDFDELYLFARRLGLKVILFTNATLLNSHLADLFARIPPLREIEVSVYGMKRASYEAVTRIPGSFEAAQRGIQLLLERKIPFVVKTALLPPNRNELDDFESWASTIPGMSGPLRYALFLDLRCRRDQAKNELIRSLRPSPEEGLMVLARRREKYLREMRKFCFQFSFPKGPRLFTCGAGIKSGCLDAYGGFQLCLMLRHPKTVYNLKEGSLRDALVRFFPEVRKFKAVNPEYLARCAQCFLKGLCEQCPAKSWTEHGTLDTPVAYFCEVAHIQARYCGLLREGEAGWKAEDWKERIERFSEKKLTSQERTRTTI